MTYIVSSCRLSDRLAMTRAKRWGLVFHEKAFVDSLFKSLNVTVIESRHVERRSDGTDYVFYMLQKT